MLRNICLFIGSDQDWSLGPPTCETVIYQWAPSPGQNSLYIKENTEGLRSHQLPTGLCHQESMQGKAKVGGCKSWEGSGCAGQEWKILKFTHLTPSIVIKSNFPTRLPKGRHNNHFIKTFYFGKLRDRLQRELLRPKARAFAPEATDDLWELICLIGPEFGMYEV